MGKLTEILSLAKERGKALGRPYMGELTPQEASELLRLAPGARIVDVRTRAEWDWVGHVAGTVEIEWNQYPGGARNPNFVAELKRQVDPEALVMFLCRSGVRSVAAVAAATERTPLRQRNMTRASGSTCRLSSAMKFVLSPPPGY